MILESLIQLAENEGLVEDPDFEFRPVSWIVRVDDGGVLLAINDNRATVEQGGKKKPKIVPRTMRVPRQPGRTSGDKAYFLCDKPEYALGTVPVVDGEPSMPADKVARRFALFRAEVRDCAEKTGDEGIRAVSSLLEGIADGSRTITLPAECGPGDLFAFFYAGDPETPVHLRPAVRAYWQERRAASAAEEDPRFACMVTGEAIGTPGLFPLLKNVPGGGSMGVALISFNFNATESHGWKGNENAPLSRAAAESAATALNRLLHPAPDDPRPENAGGKLPRRNVRLSGDTAVVFWSPDAGDGFVDAFADLIQAAEPDPEAVGSMYRGLWSGRVEMPRDPSAFYALVISGAQGRAIIRSWIITTVGEAVEHIAEHFNDLKVVRNARPAKGKPETPAVPLYALLASLSPQGRSEVPAALAAGFISAAINGVRYPQGILTRALERARAEAGADEWADLQRRDARAALIKAVLRRNYKKKDETGKTTDQPLFNLGQDMDPDNEQEGYLLGRLMAVLERLQQLALGGVNASIVDRFFGAASATPQAVFPRLLKNARHHARKAGDEKETSGTAKWLDGLIDQICWKMNVDKEKATRQFATAGFPRHLTLEQQGLFVLGYHQQRHWLWLPREERDRLEKERASASADANATAA